MGGTEGSWFDRPVGRRVRVVLAAALLAAGLEATVSAPAAQAGIGARDTSYGTDGETWVDNAEGYLRVLDTGVLADGTTVSVAWADHHVDGAPPTVEGRVVLVHVWADGTPGAITRTAVPGLGRVDAREMHGEVRPDGSAVVATGAWVAHVRADGTLDPDYGDHGVAAIPQQACCGVGLGSLAIHADGATSLLMRGSYDDAIVRLDATGALDTSFGDDGVVVTHTDRSSLQSMDLAAGIGGALYVARGIHPQHIDPGPARLQRLRADGSLDPTFGTNGSLTLPELGSALTPRPDGSVLLVVGSERVAHVLADGRFDPAFADGGVTPELLPNEAWIQPLLTLAVLADGSIAAASIQRFGVLSPTGAVTTPFDPIATRNAFPRDLDAAPGGVVATGAGSFDLTPCCDPPVLGLNRLRTDGSVVDSYGDHGRVRVVASTGGDDEARASWVDTAGRLVIANRSGNTWGMVRLLPDGALDTSFGDHGTVKVRTPVPEAFVSTADGGVAAVGPGRSDPYGMEIGSDLVQRFDASGRPVAGFGTDGQLHLDTWSRSGPLGSSPNAIAELPAGRLAIVHSRGVSVITAAGALDPTFGAGGSAAIPTRSYQSWFGSAVRFDGVGLVVATSEYADSGSDPMYLTTLRRFLLTGAVDPTFGTGGTTVLPATHRVVELLPAGGSPGGMYVALWYGAVDKVVLGGLVDPTFARRPRLDYGTTTTVDPAGRLMQTLVGAHWDQRGTWRYLTNGAPDTAFGDDGRLRIETGTPIAAQTSGSRLLLVGTDANDLWVFAVRNSEPPGIPTVSVDSVEVVEGEYADLHFTLDHPGEAAVRVTVRSTDASGRPSDSPALWDNTIISIPRGQTTATVRVMPPEDSIYEGDERTRVEILDGTQAEVGNAVGYVTVHDDDPVGDAPGTPSLVFASSDEVRFESDASRPGASFPTLMTVMVFDGSRLGWWTQVNGDHGRVQVPHPPAGKTYRVYVAASNPHGTSALAGPITYGQLGPSNPTLPLLRALNTRRGVLVKWDPDLFGPNLAFTPAVIWSVIVTSADGTQVLHASNLAGDQRGALITGLPPDTDVKVLLVGWYHSGPVVSEPSPIFTSSSTREPYLGATHAPDHIELARRGATPAVLWHVDRVPDQGEDPPIEGFQVRVVRNGTTVSVRDYPPTVRSAPLDPREIRNGSTVQVLTKTASQTLGSEVIPAAWS
jgi:uncharacterized delta-60 repeat protein